MTPHNLAWIYWNPDKFIFTVPVIDRPIAWYGFFFVLGFIIGYFMMIKMLRTLLRHTQILADRDIDSWSKLIRYLQGDHDPNIPEQKTVFAYFSEKARAQIKKIDLSQGLTASDKNVALEGINDAITDPDNAVTRSNISLYYPGAIFSLKDLAVYLTDRLTWFIVAGTLIGSRLGHVLFYDWPVYRQDPVRIFKIWEGGLASHGGAIGVFIAIALYVAYIRKRFPEVTLLKLLDNVVVPTALVAFFIRIGNFMNQEILGTKTTVPWAVVFGAPADGSGIYPRHPAQLYEAAVYLVTFFVLLWLWIKRRDNLRTGFMTGLFFVLVFGSRIIIEFFKEHQGMVIDESFMQTGQYLSIPFVLFGLWLMRCRRATA